MNPGYASLVLALIALILLASGWKDILLNGVSHRAALLFFLCWIPAWFVRVRWGQVEMDLSIAVFLAIAVIGLANVGNSLGRIHLAFLGLLLGSIIFLIQELTRLNPALLSRHSSFDVMLATVVMGVLMQRRTVQQITLLTLALLSGHFMIAYVRPLRTVIGGAAFQDLWWQTILCARVATVLLENGWETCRKAACVIAERRKDGGK